MNTDQILQEIKETIEQLESMKRKGAEYVSPAEIPLDLVSLISQLEGRLRELQAALKNTSDVVTIQPEVIRLPNELHNYCPNCGRETRSEFRFCPNCGTSLIEEKAKSGTQIINIHLDHGVVAVEYTVVHELADEMKLAIRLLEEIKLQRQDTFLQAFKDEVLRRNYEYELILKELQHALHNPNIEFRQYAAAALGQIESIKQITAGHDLIGATSLKGIIITRYTDISCPGQIWIGITRFSIILRLTILQSKLSSAVEKLELAQDYPVIVRLHSLAFELLNESEQAITIPSEGDSLPIVFDLRPLDLGHHTVTLDFFQAGNPVGTVSLPIEVAAEDVIATVGGPPAQPLRFQTAIVPPERMLYVSYERFQDKPALSFTLFRAGEVGQTFRPVLLESELESHAARLYEGLTILREAADPTAKAFGKRRILPPEDAEERLVVFGQNLWRDLIPQDLKDIYATERADWHNQTLLIVSDEPYLPWELIWPYAKGWEDPGPWCETLLLTRWLRRDFQGNGHEAPANRLPFQSLACLVPTDSGLKAALEEHRFLAGLVSDHKLKDLTPNPPSWSKVRELLKSGGYNWLHAAAHGNFYPEHPESDSAIWLQDGHAFTPQDVVGPKIEEYIHSSRPGFVFNACHSGRQDWALTRLGGWANRLISSGAGFFLAPLWTVTDDLALEFSKALYTELFNGKTVAEAVRAARIAAKKQGDPTWLAYSVYAHPNARVII